MHVSHDFVATKTCPRLVTSF